METKHIDILLTGKIQNIGFTLQVMKAADELSICGYATYLNKNTVKIEAEGEESNLSKFINVCKRNIPEASISNLTINQNTTKGFKEFSIADKEQYQRIMNIN